MKEQLKLFDFIVIKNEMKMYPSSWTKIAYMCVYMYMYTLWISSRYYEYRGEVDIFKYRPEEEIFKYRGEIEIFKYRGEVDIFKYRSEVDIFKYRAEVGPVGILLFYYGAKRAEAEIAEYGYGVDMHIFFL